MQPGAVVVGSVGYTGSLVSLIVNKGDCTIIILKYMYIKVRVHCIALPLLYILLHLYILHTVYSIYSILHPGDDKRTNFEKTFKKGNSIQKQKQKQRQNTELTEKYLQSFSRQHI